LLSVQIILQSHTLIAAVSPVVKSYGHWMELL